MTLAERIAKLEAEAARFIGRCTGCGSTDREDLTTGDQGYSACCNEPIETTQYPMI